MKRIFDLIPVDLTLFDGEGGGATGIQGSSESPAQRVSLEKGGVSRRESVAASGDATGAGLRPDAAGTQLPGSSRRGKKSGGLDTVVYGKQADTTHYQNSNGSPAQRVPFERGGATERADAGDLSPAQLSGVRPDDSDAGSQQEKPLTEEEKRAKFRELIEGDFKDVYAQEFQNAFNRRFKDVKENEEALTAYRPVMDTLFAKYKIADGDVGKLNAAIENDDSYWTAAAEEAGMTTEQYRQFVKLQRENQALKRTQQQEFQQQRARAQMLKWSQEAEGLKAVYPDFDLALESRNQNFLDMLKAGVPVKHAYEVIHIDDIKTSTAKTTAQQTEKQVVDNIRAKGARPAENGVSSQSGITFKADASKLTKEDRAEIARRVQRGEQITF